MKTRRLPLAALTATLLPFVLALVVNGCKKEEEPPPPPPPPPPTPVVTAPPAVVAPEEDAGADADAGDASDGAVKKSGPPSDPSGLKACCNALRQNGPTMPPPFNSYAPAAAGACDALAASARDRASALATIRGMMKGAGMPAACQ